MKLEKPITIKEIAEFLNIQFFGNQDLKITGINEIHKVVNGDLTFVDIEKYYKKAINSEATTILINKKISVPEGKAILVSSDPFGDYNKLVDKYKSHEIYHANNAFIDEDSKIGEGTKIFPGAYIANDVIIGENCLIYPNVTIHSGTRIGNNVIIKSNSVIGADAYYFKRYETQYVKMKSCGRVIIKDDVEIGSSCSVDKGVSGDTIIGTNTKLDSQVHVAHGVEIGARCLITAQVGIGGKAIIEDEVILLGQVGVIKDIRIGKGAVVLSGTGVSKSLEGGKVYFGVPAREIKVAYKELASLRGLPDLMKIVREIETKVFNLKNS